MKIVKYILLLHLSVGNIFLIHAQEIKKQLTDSSYIFGTIKPGFISNTLNGFCMVEAQKYITEEKTVIVKGIYKCVGSYSSAESKFLVEVILKNTSYYVEKENIILTDDNFYEQYQQFSETEKENFRENAVEGEKILERQNVSSMLKFVDKCIPKGLCIVNWNIYDESEYTEGTSLKIKVVNPTKKTIKYLWFTYVGYNPVKDKVVDRMKGTSSIILKAVGPIEKDATSTYQFEYAWHTDLVETAKLVQIKVQYMDGSVKIITEPNTIRMTSEMAEMFEEEE